MQVPASSPRGRRQPLPHQPQAAEPPIGWQHRDYGPYRRRPRWLSESVPGEHEEASEAPPPGTRFVYGGSDPLLPRSSCTADHADVSGDVLTADAESSGACVSPDIAGPSHEKLGKKATRDEMDYYS